MSEFYQKREFCKDTGCFVQTEVEKGNQHAKLFCVNHCKAWEFHNWLQLHDYSIIKEGSTKE